MQRLGGGINLGPNRDRLALVFAVGDLARTFYREQFQFAPSRRRSFTVGLHRRGQ